jgi:hypothetical protein
MVLLYYLYWSVFIVSREWAVVYMYIGDSGRSCICISVIVGGRVYVYRWYRFCLYFYDFSNSFGTVLTVWFFKKKKFHFISKLKFT